MLVKQVYPAKSEAEGRVFLFEAKIDRERFLASPRGVLADWRALKPRPLARFDQDHDKVVPVAAECGPRATLTDDELASILGRLATYRHGDNLQHRHGATFEVRYSTSKSDSYVAPAANAQRYPDLQGAYVPTSVSTRTKTWKKRLSDPAIKPKHASITVTVKGKHLPSGTPEKWRVEKIAPNEWRITTSNPYVFVPNRETDD